MPIDEWEILTDNPFKVGSDKWRDRALINSHILNITCEIEQTEDTINKYSNEIKKDMDKGFYPNVWCELTQESIKRYRTQVTRLNAELEVLNIKGVSDREKLKKYWRLHNADA